MEVSMTAGKIIAYIAAAIMILFGVLFIWATFSPEGQIGWPLYFVGYAFFNNRKFGTLFMLGLLIDSALRLLPYTQNFWR